MTENASSGRQSLQRAAVRYLGVLPRQAPASARLRWKRSVYLKLALPWLPIDVAASIIIDATWFYVLLAVLFVAWSASILLISRDIRRARRTEAAN